MFTHFDHKFHELSGKTWGIIGLGNIGRRVADIAKWFGCNVIYYSTSGKNDQKDYKRVEFDELLAASDIVSVHAPLTDDTLGLMNREAFSKMKNSAIFLNLGRGPIVEEADLAKALDEGELAAAGLDVLTKEPVDAQGINLARRECAWYEKAKNLGIEILPKITMGILYLQKKIYKN